jgi:hypothetical protein
MHFFPVGKENVYAVPPRTIGDLVARLQAAVRGVDANILGVFERMPCSALQSALNTCCNYEVLTV